MPKTNKVIVISGVSGSGKTTLVNYLLEQKEFNLSFSISACSRSQRPNESDGKNYLFLSPSEFNYRIKTDQFLEWEEVYPGHFYGTLKESVDNLIRCGKNILFDIDVKGALSIKKHFKDQARTIYIQPSSIDTIKKRLINRNTESRADLKLRIQKMQKEILFGINMDYQLINDDLAFAKSDIYDYVKKFLNL